MCTKLVPVAFDPAARCPRWERFLEEIMLGDRDVIEFLRRALALTLLGAVPEHVVLFLFGTGANGKTVFLEVVRALLGDYAATTPFRTLLHGGGEITGNDIVRLRGARLVTAVEAGGGARFDEEKLKLLTGGDTVVGRPLYGEFVEFRPQLTLWLATNHEPAIHGTDEGIWRRIQKVPFRWWAPPERRDPGLTETLVLELPGILAWATRGMAALLKGGLQSPDAVRGATENYRVEQDAVGQFVADRVETAEGARATKADVYEAYVAWAKACGIARPWTKIALGKGLRERRWSEQKSDGVDYWIGVRLKLAPESPPPRENPDY